MRVLIAPDCFGGTLTAREAADAIATGWREAKPGDVVAERPLADGGPGFVDVLHAATGGDIRHVSVTGPLGEPVEARWLSVHADGRRVAYVESAEACGLHLIPAELRPQTCETATTRGVGELIAAAAADNDVVTVGLGGSGTTDGGAGMLAALSDAGVDLTGTALVAASDVENPLLGPHGAARTFGPQKGASPEAVERLEVKLAAMDVLKPVSDMAGAGAAGGLGAALLSLGATMTSGARLVRDLTGLDAALDDSDVVITGEGSFDWQSLRGKLVTAVAGGAAERGIPCIAIAGQVSVGRREMGAAGVQAAYSVSEHVGSVHKSIADARKSLIATAQHVARQWSR
ncbi:glycerate kinase family protein [Lentzea flaviverrucosa]|uniref:Glycerate kinase n=1 Tax=Lentzea flaviverrucosa TaxID=200379 RepID=A0A1H9XN82_9PSEU|nr:glycerate kinase [Lentzea flaviverrucosa]RDI20437.1 glycerate kinase [Lentzea flaviverrucosa]SES47133.1 glycerate kinase [Lentzea flaviverrucosa]